MTFFFFYIVQIQEELIIFITVYLLVWIRLALTSTTRREKYKEKNLFWSGFELVTFWKFIISISFAILSSRKALEELT